GGHWRQDEASHQLPFVFFERANVAASPFDLLRKKIDEPNTFKLQSAYERLLAEITRREHLSQESTLLSTEALAREMSRAESEVNDQSYNSSAENSLEKAEHPGPLSTQSEFDKSKENINGSESSEEEGVAR